MSKSIILYDNIFANALNEPEATSEQTNYEAVNIADLNVGSFFKSDSISFPQYVTVNAGSEMTANSLGIIGHNLGSNNYEISVEHANDDPEGSSGAIITEALAPFIPDDDNAIGVELDASGTDFWWRIKIDKASPESTDEEPFAAVIILGQKLQFANLNVAPLVLRDELPIKESRVSKGGQHLNNTKLRTELNPKGILPMPSLTWMNDNFLPFWENHAEDGKPFFWIPDITNFPSSVYFVRWRDGFSFKMPMSTGEFVDRINYEFVAIKEEN